MFDKAGKHARLGGSGGDIAEKTTVKLSSAWNSDLFTLVFTRVDHFQTVYRALNMHY